MSISDLEHLRRRIEITLTELGIPNTLWSCVKATSFEQEHNAERPHKGVLAIWLTDRNIIEFYDENDVLLKTVSLDQEDMCDKAA